MLSGLPGSHVCYGLPGCSPPCTDLTSFPANGGLYFQAFDGSVTLPLAGYDYSIDWTPMLTGLSPAGLTASLAAPTLTSIAAMSRELVNSLCRTFPGAEVSDPWGRRTRCLEGRRQNVCLRWSCLARHFSENGTTAGMLIDAGVGARARYLHRSWVRLPWGTAEDELRYRLAVSYRLVRSGLTKRLQAQRAPIDQ